MKQDLRILGRIALLAIAALVAAPIIFFLLVAQGQTGLSARAPVAVLVATLVWLAYLGFAPKPD